MPCAGPTGISMIGCCGGDNGFAELVARVYNIGLWGICQIDLGREFIGGCSWTTTYSRGGGSVSGSFTLPPVVRRRTDGPTLTIQDNTDATVVANWMHYFPGNVQGGVTAKNCNTQSQSIVQAPIPDPTFTRQTDMTCSTSLIPVDKAAVKARLLSQGFNSSAAYKNDHIMDRLGNLDNAFPLPAGYPAYPSASLQHLRDVDARRSFWLNYATPLFAGLPNDGGSFQNDWSLYFTAYQGDPAGYFAALNLHKPATPAIGVSIYWRYLTLRLYKNLIGNPYCLRESIGSNIVLCQKGIQAREILVDVPCTAPYNVGEDAQLYATGEAGRPPCCDNVAP